ncbi:response regulator transcription factor [Streptococcus caprae]|uniref:Response regulator transcription factor n=1 Tax=Streptococcus caprae TaxID=1640501 RepID=A0ABV8CX17_9STRE
MSARIYLADDEANIRQLLESFLVREGYEVSTFETGDQLLLAFMENPADVVVLDVMMPGSDGFAIAQEIRKRSQVPLILLTARDSDQDYLDGFKAGIDDYFTKPFSPLKLVLRIKAILQRLEYEHQDESAKKMEFADLALKPNDRVLVSRGNQLPLTNTEYDVLRVLMAEAGQAVSRERLLREIWGYESNVETRATDDTIKRLRKKLRQIESQVSIETVWGYGFKLCQKQA